MLGGMNHNGSNGFKRKNINFGFFSLAPFVRDLGYEGPPFLWDNEERRHLRARLDALYFHLYGINREDADYILRFEMVGLSRPRDAVTYAFTPVPARMPLPY